MQLVCKSRKWQITTRSIDIESGCCGRTQDTQDIRGVTDLSHKSSLACGLGRGTVKITSRDPSHPNLELRSRDSKNIYRNMKDALAAAKANQTTIYEQNLL